MFEFGGRNIKEKCHFQGKQEHPPIPLKPKLRLRLLTKEPTWKPAHPREASGGNAGWKENSISFA